MQSSLVLRLPVCVQEFLADRERRGIKTSSIQLYREVLTNLHKRYRLDLASASGEEILRMLDLERRRVKIRYYGLEVMLVKRILRNLKREDIRETIPNVRRQDPTESIKDQLLLPEERRRLIEKAPTLQDRLIFELLDETGGRRGEICSLRIQDVQFDEYGAILQLTGKTGTRRRRVYESVPDLRAHLNNHPQKGTPQAPLLLNRYGTKYTGPSLYLRVRSLAERILGHRIRPHQFRHTRATDNSRYFTDREMMKLFGWKSPEMVGVYSHLSMRDVDEKDLVLHGLKKRDEILKPLVEVRRCPKCNGENAPIAIYCCTCGATLTGPPPHEITGGELVQAIQDHPEIIEQLANMIKERSIR